MNNISNISTDTLTTFQCEEISFPMNTTGNWNVRGPFIWIVNKSDDCEQCNVLFINSVLDALAPASFF